jgi:hypothetical protein
MSGRILILDDKSVNEDFNSLKLMSLLNKEQRELNLKLKKLIFVKNSMRLKVNWDYYYTLVQSNWKKLKTFPKRRSNCLLFNSPSIKNDTGSKSVPVLNSRLSDNSIFFKLTSIYCKLKISLLIYHKTGDFHI